MTTAETATDEQAVTATDEQAVTATDEQAVTEANTDEEASTDAGDKATVVLEDGTTIIIPSGTTATITADEAETGGTEASSGDATTEGTATGETAEAVTAVDEASETSASADGNEELTTEESGNGHETVTDGDVTTDASETKSVDDAVTTEMGDTTDGNTSELLTTGTNGIILFSDRMVCARRPQRNDEPVFSLLLFACVDFVFLSHSPEQIIIFSFFSILDGIDNNGKLSLLRRCFRVFLSSPLVHALNNRVCVFAHV